MLKREDMGYYLPVTHTDGFRGEALRCKSRYDRSELSPEDMPKPEEKKEYLMQMDGREVFMFAVKERAAGNKRSIGKRMTRHRKKSVFISCIRRTEEL